jgi:hypothetical protein
MPWQVKAEGHALSEAAEKKLFRLLAKLFRNEDYGAAGPIQFTGDHVNGNPMSDEDLANAKAPVDEDDEEPEAKLVPKGETYPVQVHEGTGEPMVAVEHSADGTMSPPVSNEPEGEHDSDDVGDRG